MRRVAKNCPLCEHGIRQINYKDDRTMTRMMTEQGKSGGWLPSTSAVGT